jgi:hypothetical protein
MESTGERWDIRSRSSGGRRSRFVAAVVGSMLEIPRQEIVHYLWTRGNVPGI